MWMGRKGGVVCKRASCDGEGKREVCLVSVGSWREWCAHAVYEVMAPALVCSTRSA